MEEQNRSRQDEMREDGEISKFQAEINEEMYGFMTEFKEEFAQFRAQHNEQKADIRSKLHTIKDLLHDMMKGVGLEPPLDRVNSNPDGPTLEYSEYSASTIDARYDEMLELNRALDSEENGDYDSSGEEITTKQSLGQLDLGDEASNMLDGLNKQQPSLKLRSVGVAHHLFGDVPRPLLFEQSDRNAGLKSFPGKFYSNSMIEKVELSSPKAEIQLDGKVQQPFSFKHEVAKVVYKVFDEMPKLSLVDPNEESYANKDSITLIDCVPLALDSANGLSCHLFDPGGGHLPQTASQATLIYKYGRNDESSMPDNLCVCIVEGGLNEACKPLMQLQVDCLSWTQKALDSDDVELVRMQFCSLLNKVQPTIMSATYQYNGNVGNFLVAMEKMIVKGWIGEISMFEFDPGGCSRPYMGCGSLEYNNEQEDSKVLHKRDIDGSSCVELIAASCGITLQNGESEDSCGGIVDETLGGSVMLLVYFFDTDVYAYFNWVKVAQLLLFDTSEIDEPGVHILSESQQKGDVQFMIKIREMFTQLNLVLMLNDRIQCVSRLESALTKAEDHLSKLPPDTPYSEFGYVLQELGFERGWGDTASRVLEMMHLLSNRGIKRKPIYAVHSYLGSYSTSSCMDHVTEFLVALPTSSSTRTGGSSCLIGTQNWRDRFRLDWGRPFDSNNWKNVASVEFVLLGEDLFGTIILQQAGDVTFDVAQYFQLGNSTINSETIKEQSVLVPTSLQAYTSRYGILFSVPLSGIESHYHDKSVHLQELDWKVDKNVCTKFVLRDFIVTSLENLHTFLCDICQDDVVPVNFE